MTPAAESAVAFFEGLIESIKSGQFVQMEVRTTPHRTPCVYPATRWYQQMGEVTSVTHVIALVTGPEPPRPASPRPRCRCGSPEGASRYTGYSGRKDNAVWHDGWHEPTCPELP